MARKRQRGRHTGRFEPGDTFAAIPVEILRSEAYAALPDYAARVLFALAAQFRGRNNGALSLAVKTGREFGIRSAWKVQAGLRLLLDVGMVEMTRPGKYAHGRGICALYALAWRTINVTPEAFPPIDNERPAPNAWAKWQRADSWAEFEVAVRRGAQGASNKWNSAHDHSRRQEQASSRRQELENADTHPTSSRRLEQDGTVSSSRRLGALLDSGRGARNPSRLTCRLTAQSESARLSSVESKIAKLIRAQPHLTDSDIARVLSQLGVSIEQVAAVRGAQ